MEKKYSGVRIFGFIVMILGISVVAMVAAALMKGKQLPDWFLAQLFLFVTMWVLRGVLKLHRFRRQNYHGFREFLSIR